MKTTGNSLQDLRHIQKTLQAQREQAAARQKALQEQQAKEKARHHQFAHAVGKVQALRGDHAKRVRQAGDAPPPIPAQRERDHAAIMQEALSDGFDATSLLETDEDLSYRRPEIGADVLRKLRQGHWSIQAQIDLHGLRRDGAREALTAFIRDCQRQGIRCVRIVTGKGLGSPNRMPVLKHKVHGWLVQKQEVLAFVQARPAEGGAGALVVLLSG